MPVSDIKSVTLGEFMKELGSAAPAPGGGSIAALSGAMGACLVSMVCNLTTGKEKYIDFEPLVQDTLAKSGALAESLMDCARKDIAAFDGVAAAFKMPKGSEEERELRSQAIRSAYKAAALPPEMTAGHCLEVMRLARELLRKSNKNVASDLLIAALQAHAGLLGALENVAVNLPHVKDEGYITGKRSWIECTEREGNCLLDEVRSGVADAAGW